MGIAKEEVAARFFPRDFLNIPPVTPQPRTLQAIHQSHDIIDWGDYESKASFQVPEESTGESVLVLKRLTVLLGTPSGDNRS